MLNITHIIFNLSTGGAEKLLIDMIKQNNTQSKHHILVFGREKKNNLKINKNITYLNYNIFNYFFFIIKNRKKNMILKYWLHNVFILSIFPIFFGNYKIVLFVHNELIDLKYLGYKNYIFCHFNKLISNCATINILFCSNSSKKHHLNFGFKGNNAVIHNFINQKIYRYKKKVRKGYNTKLKIVMVANKTNAKNHSLLIQILSHLTKINYLCDLYGLNIKKSKTLLKLIEKYNLKKNVKLNNYKFSKNLYSNYDFSFLISNTESFPMVVLESICEGTLCIASDVGDISKIIDKKFLINNTKNIKFLGKKIESILQLRFDSKKYNRISHEKLKYLKNNFDNKIIFPKYYKFWCELKS